MFKRNIKNGERKTANGIDALLGVLFVRIPNANIPSSGP